MSGFSSMLQRIPALLLLGMVAAHGCHGAPAPVYPHACALIQAEELAALTDKGVPQVDGSAGPSECQWDWAPRHRDLVWLSLERGLLQDLSGTGFVPLEGYEATAIWRPGALIVSIDGRRANLNLSALLPQNAPVAQVESTTKELARLLHERLPHIAPEALPSPN